VGFAREHPTSAGFVLPVTVPCQARRFDRALSVSVLESSVSVAIPQDGCLRQSLAPTWGSTVRDVQTSFDKEPAVFCNVDWRQSQPEFTKERAFLVLRVLAGKGGR